MSLPYRYSERLVRIGIPAPSVDVVQAEIDSRKETATTAMIRLAWRLQEPRVVDTIELQAREAFTSIGNKLEKLASLEVSSCSLRYAIPISALGNCLFQLKDQLKSLHLGGVRLRGTQAQFEQAFHSLACMTKLKTFSCQSMGATIVGSSLVSPPEMAGWATDSMIRAVKGIGTLETVRLRITQPSMPTIEPLFAAENCKVELSVYGTDLPVHLIQTMCAPNSTVCKLRLSSIPNISNVAAVFADGLRNNQTIRELSLVGNYARETCTTILTALQTSTCLTTLRLDASTSTLAPICESVLVAPNLRQFDLTIIPPSSLNNANGANQWEDLVVDNLCELLFHKLDNNQKLKGLRILVHTPHFRHAMGDNANGCSDTWRQACNIKLNKCLEEVLETNCHLQNVRVYLMGSPLPLSETVLFWLRFNHAGRVGLMENPDNRQQWVNLIANEPHDTQLVYHLLLKHPGWVLPAIGNCDKAERRGRLKRRRDGNDFYDLVQRSKRIRRSLWGEKGIAHHNQIRHEVVQLYENAAHVPPYLMDAIFTCDLETQLQKQTVELVTWLARWMPVYEDHILQQNQQSRTGN